MTKLPSPKLIWLEDGTPFSEHFGDVYIGSGATSEIQHVFLDGINIPQILKEGKTLTIIETGFGTGLNFLAVWKLWRERVSPGSRLNYISVEGYPMARKDMSRAHAPYPSYANLSKELCNNLPPLVTGYHEVSFDNGRVRLLLLYGQVQEMLSGLVAKADAWFLDGFAPAKNPAMWTPEVLEIIRQLSKLGTRFATFTAAGEVRRGLEAVGFCVNKRPGYGRKRECLIGFMEQKKTDQQYAPWFAVPKPVNEGRKVAVIGAGIAGCCLARNLSEKGWDVKIYEAEKKPGMGASGTPSAILQPRPFFNEDATSWFHAVAYLRAIKFYEDLEKDGNPIWQSRGLLAVGRDYTDGERYKRFAKSGTLPPGHVEWIDSSTASKKIGLAIPVGGAWFPTSGSLDTRMLCRALVKGLCVKINAKISKICRRENLWLLIDKDGKTLGKAPNIAIAAGYQSEILSGFGNFGLVANRGQLTLLHSPNNFSGQKAPLSYGGYLTPPVSRGDDESLQVMGASFERINNPDAKNWVAPSVRDDEVNVRTLAQRFPNLETCPEQHSEGWVGLRATTVDRFPVVGGVPEPHFFETNYANLDHGGKARKFPLACYRPGMYVLTGLGSQGFLMAPLLADLLAAVITGIPASQPRAILNLMHPGRFLIRSLKRGIA